MLIRLPLALSLSGLFALLFLEVFEFLLDIAFEILLSSSHLLDIDLLLSHFFVNLTLDLLKNANTLTVGSLQVLHAGKDLAELITEVLKVLVDLCDLVESDDLLRVVIDSHDKAESVALVKEAFDLVPVAIEVHHLGERCKLDVSEEVFAFLENTDGQSFLDEWHILGQVRHDLAGLAERFTTQL